MDPLPIQGSLLNTTTKASMGFLPKYEDSPQSDCSNTDADATCSLPSKFSLSKHSTVKNLSSSSQGDTQSRTLPVQPSTISGTPAINIDSLINNIYSLLKSEASGEQNVVSELEITVLCDLASRVFLRQPSLLELNPADSGLTIVGDLHGHLNDLSSIFKKEGGPDVHNYLFLGNYVGIGRHQVELIALLLACKLKYPENFFLLRGSHESRETNHTDGFWHRCWDMYQNEQVWTKLNHCFDTMPYAAVLGDRILCVHSGLSPHLQTMLQLRNIKRPVPIPPNGLLYDLVSAAPTVITPGWNTNQQNTAMIFGHGVWKKFFKANELEFMIRSHGTLGPGFAITDDRKILSIFSATDYEARENDAAFVHISPNLTVQLYTFDAKATFRERKLDRKEI